MNIHWRIPVFSVPVLCLAFVGNIVQAQLSDTLPALGQGSAPANFEEMWQGFDPRAEPLETETLHQWEEDGVSLSVVRFRIGVFKGQRAMLAAVFGYPKSALQEGKKVPGLLQIHGGGQYADYRACLTNAKRGYATVSIAWAGRISTPNYSVSPREVQLFWDQKTSDPGYRVTTDWGRLDGYHAPGRNAGNQFPSAKPAAWTLDSIESPRNSGWFLGALAARRALTFLEQQPVVNADRLGVYGHSMGGKLTVMSSVDTRVKAAAPSCGGISDRYNDSDLFNQTIGDRSSLRQIQCPIIFLSPANDFHGRIGNLATATDEIQSRHWRVSCSPHHNHQDTPPYEVATQLWFDQHLKGSFQFPSTPATKLELNPRDGVPVLTVQPDLTQTPLEIDIYYTQQGKPDERPLDRLDTMHRFWHHVRPTRQGDSWIGKLPLESSDRPLWVFANVRYPLENAITGAGYYYGSYTADSYNLSSLLTTSSSADLLAADCNPTLKPTHQIETFTGDWKKEWFGYRVDQWAVSSNKIGNQLWQAPPKARLTFRVQSDQPNKLVILLDQHAAEVDLQGGGQWQVVSLAPSDFMNAERERLTNWTGLRTLKLSPAENLRPKTRNRDFKPRRVGKNWIGSAPKFRDLGWSTTNRPINGGEK